MNITARENYKGKAILDTPDLTTSCEYLCYGIIFNIWRDYKDLMNSEEKEEQESLG